MNQMKGLRGTTISEKGIENSGITLIALVITIIILLILATVSIAIITGDNNGILSTAKQTRTETIQATEKEQIGLAYNAVVTTQYANATYDASKGIKATELQEELQKQKTGATALEDTTEGVIKITFDKSKNVYNLDSKKGTIEGPIASSVDEDTE